MSSNLTFDETIERPVSIKRLYEIKAEREAAEQKRLNKQEKWRDLNRLVADGMTNAEIARIMNVSWNAVKKRRDKLGI